MALWVRAVTDEERTELQRRAQCGTEPARVVERARMVGLASRSEAIPALGLRPGDRVLDLSCGAGDLAIALRRMGAGTVVGLDIAAAMLRRGLAKEPSLGHPGGRSAAALRRRRLRRRWDGVHLT